MISSLCMFLALRRLRGRHVGVLVRGDDGVRPWADARPALFGLWGVAPDGDHVFVPWADVTLVEAGAGSEASYGRLRARAGVLDGALDEGLSPMEAFIRAARAEGRANGEAKPALSPEEIAAVLAEGDMDSGDTATLSAELDRKLSGPAVDHESRLFPDRGP